MSLVPSSSSSGADPGARKFQPAAAAQGNGKMTQLRQPPLQTTESPRIARSNVPKNPSSAIEGDGSIVAFSPLRATADDSPIAGAASVSSLQLANHCDPRGSRKERK
jgi:hypothetical protein